MVYLQKNLREIYSYYIYNKEDYNQMMDSLPDTIIKFKKWYFGYYHDYRQVNSQFILLYEDIVTLEFQSIFS